MEEIDLLKNKLMLKKEKLNNILENNVNEIIKGELIELSIEIDKLIVEYYKLESGKQND